MKNRLIGTITVSAVLIFAGVATSAWEGTGNLNTGFGSNTIQGTVGTPTPTVTPTPTPTSTPTPTPTQNNSGGGGGGGGGGANNGNQGQVSGVSTILGDINKDGKVDVLDFNALVVNWGNNPQNINADLTGDGKVDILDFNALMVAWPH
ncbi:MAG: dockerin type I repeat-containing protein [Patescibacteria group bacterium]